MKRFAIAAAWLALAAPAAAAGEPWLDAGYWTQRMQQRATPAPEGARDAIAIWRGQWSALVTPMGGGAPVGRFLLRVAADGAYLAVFQGAQGSAEAFRTDGGYLSATAQGFRLTSLTGWHEEGLWTSVEGGRLAMMRQMSIATLSRATPAEIEAFDHLGAGLRGGPGMTVAELAMTAAVWARFWAADAEPRSIELRPRSNGVLDLAGSEFFAGFYAPSRNATLTLAMEPGKATMGFFNGLVAAGDQTGTKQALPVPLGDLGAAIETAKTRNLTGPWSGATLKTWSQRVDRTKARVAWVLTGPTTRAGRGDVCFDVGAAALFDCKLLFDDSVADFNALAARAAAEIARARAASSRSPAAPTASGGQGCGPGSIPGQGGTLCFEPYWRNVQVR